MIVIGVDVHKQSLTAVAVDEAGRMLAEKTVAAADGELVAWASGLGGERLWALEDCRQLTRALERELLAVGEQLVRVPPKLMAPERRAGRARGKSDPIDALAVARAALREPRLSRPRPDEQPFRDLNLLVDHRDDLVDERRRAQQRLRWHLHQLDPSFAVPAKALDRPVHLDRGPRRPRRRCSSCPAAMRSPPRSCSPRSDRSAASRRTRSSPGTAASRRSKRAQAACNATALTVVATGNSTARSTGSRSRKRAITPRRSPTSSA